MMKKSETIYFWGAPAHTQPQIHDAALGIDRQTDKTRTNTTAAFQNAAAAATVSVWVWVWEGRGVGGVVGVGLAY